MSESAPVRTISSYRREAREHLRGKWLRLFLPMLFLMLIGGILIPASVEIPSSSYDAGLFAHHLADFSAGGSSTPLIVYDEDYQELYEFLNRPVPEVSITSPRSASLDLPLAAAALMLVVLYFLLGPVYHNASAQLFLGIYEEQPRSLRTGPRKYFRLAGALILRGLLTLWPMWIAAGWRLSMHLSAAAHNPPDPFIIYILYAIFAVFAAIYTFVQTYRYRPVPLISALHPELTARELLEESRRIMSGRVWKLFCLDLSCIGWLLLALLPAFVTIGLFSAYLFFAQSTSEALASPLVSVAIHAALMLPVAPVYLYRKTAGAVFICCAAQS